MQLRKFLRLVLFSACSLASAGLLAQRDCRELRIHHGRMELRIDRKADRACTAAVLEAADMPWLNLDSLFQHGLPPRVRSEGWELKQQTRGRIVLQKPLEALGDPGVEDHFELVSEMKGEMRRGIPGYPGYPEDVSYGVNRWKDKRPVQENEKGETVFSLAGHEHAREVYLSGNFNNWSTLTTPMRQVDGQWQVVLKLKPGPYLYKFVVDGKWLSDPDNPNREDDGYGGHNSKYFRYNYQFALTGYPDAKNVRVAGSFNGWKEKELVMERSGDAWLLPLYLREGTHAYKFIVDRDWILDPAAPVARPDQKGNLNSYVGLGDTLLFRLRGFESARTVYLSGSFNAWNPAELAMTRKAEGWELPYVLAPGNHEYKFVVDGTWITDPDNPVFTGEGRYVNSVRIVGANHDFRLPGFADAHEVLLSGSFNSWAEPGYRMQRRDGEWRLSLHLPPGKYNYKFVADGAWILDPTNPFWEDNEYGTGNSFIWIEPEVVFVE